MSTREVFNIPITSFLIAGTSAGLTQYSDAIHTEFADLASAVQSLNQSYSFFGTNSPSVQTAGSNYFDQQDAPVVYPEPGVVMQSVE